MRGNQAPEGQQIEDRAGGLLLEFYRAPLPLRALVSILHAVGVPSDDVWNPAVHWQAGALYQTLGTDLPLSESDEGRSVLTFDKRHFPLPGNMLFIFPTTRLPPGRPCHPRTTTLLHPPPVSKQRTLVETQV